MWMCYKKKHVISAAELRCYVQPPTCRATLASKPCKFLGFSEHDDVLSLLDMLGIYLCLFSTV